MSLPKRACLYALLLNLYWVTATVCACYGTLVVATKPEVVPLLQNGLFDVNSPALFIYLIGLFWAFSMIIGHMRFSALIALGIGALGFGPWFYLAANIAYTVRDPLGFVAAALSVLAWVIFWVATLVSPPVPPDEPETLAEEPQVAAHETAP